MAEAIAKHVAADVIEPSSAGLVPFGEIPATTLAVLAEHGISAEGQRSKASASGGPCPAADLVVNMTGATRRVDLQRTHAAVRGLGRWRPVRI